MQEEWLLLEEGLHPSRAIWVKMALKQAGVEFRIYSDEGGENVLVPLTEEHHLALERVEDLVQAYHLTLEAAGRRGLKIRPYKPLEHHVAFIAALQAHREADAEDPRSIMKGLLHAFV